MSRVMMVLTYFWLLKRSTASRSNPYGKRSTCNPMNTCFTVKGLELIFWLCSVYAMNLNQLSEYFGLASCTMPFAG